MISHSKQMMDVAFNSDHTFAWSRHGHRPTDVGHWQLRGRYLIWTFTSPAKGRKPGTSYHDTILKLTDQALIYVQGKDSNAAAVGEEVHLTRRSSEPLAAPRSSFQ